MSDSGVHRGASVVHNTLHKEHERALQRQRLDAYNRLHSIEHDAHYVAEVCVQYPDLPVIANQRCGAWYVDPEKAYRASAYFKSTDGHAGQWSFSLRRSNLHLVEVAQKHGGFILVDSTRRGKSYPDALSKTVPLWCAVINRAARMVSTGRESTLSEEDALLTPPDVISHSERAQMRERIESFARESSPASDILKTIHRPLRPVFVHPSRSPPALYPPAQYLSVVCLSASRTDHCVVRQPSDFTYVPGSGDDHEGWAVGLTPALFWSNRLRLLSSTRNDLKGLMLEIVNDHGEEPATEEPKCLHISPQLKFDLGATTRLDLSDAESNIWLSSTPTETLITATSLFQMGMRPGRRGHEMLMSRLDAVLAFADQALRSGRTVHVRYDAADLKGAASVLVLAILVRLFDDEVEMLGAPCMHPPKSLVRRRLHLLTARSEGEINPPRALLTRLNRHIIPWSE